MKKKINKLCSAIQKKFGSNLKPLILLSSAKDKKRRKDISNFIRKIEMAYKNASRSKLVFKDKNIAGKNIGLCQSVSNKKRIKSSCPCPSCQHYLLHDCICDTYVEWANGKNRSKKDKK